MFRSILLTFSVRIISAALNFFVLVMISQELGAAGKGFYSKFIAIIANALIFCDLIGGPALVYLATKIRVRQMLLPSYLFSLFSSVIVLAVFLLLGQIPASPSQFVFFVSLSFLNSAIAIHQNILSGKLAFGKLNALIFIQAVLLFSGMKIMFSLAPPTFISCLWGLMIAMSATAAIGFGFVLSVKNEGENCSFGNFFSRAFAYGFINQAGHLLQFLNQRLSFFLLGEKSLGIFSNATAIGESVWMASNSIATVQYGKISNTENEKTASGISLVLLKLNLLVVFCGALVLTFLPDVFFTWLFGSEFGGIHRVLVYLFPGLVFFSGFLIMGHHFSGRGEFVKNVYVISFGLLFTLSGLAFVYFSAIPYSLTVAAIITSFSYLGNFIFALILFSKKAKFTLRDFFPSKADFLYIKREFHNKKTAN